jgi:hypothetical protein
VAIDRATRWVFVRIYPAQTAANARRFLRDLERAAPMKITRVLTDNGKAFTDRLFGLRKRAATGQHEFDLLCTELGIEHRLTPPMRPQTNGMVERFNGRIEDVLQSHRFLSGEDLEKTLLRYTHLWPSSQPLPETHRPTAAPGAPAPQSSTSKPTRFFGTVELDASRPIRSLEAIMSAVVAELQRTPGTRIKLTVEIEAVAEGGFDEADIGVVRDNTRQLKFRPESTGFGE